MTIQALSRQLSTVLQPITWLQDASYRIKYTWTAYNYEMPSLIRKKSKLIFQRVDPSSELKLTLLIVIRNSTPVNNIEEPVVTRKVERQALISSHLSLFTSNFLVETSGRMEQPMTRTIAPHRKTSFEASIFVRGRTLAEHVQN